MESFGASNIKAIAIFGRSKLSPLRKGFISRNLEQRAFQVPSKDWKLEIFSIILDSTDDPKIFLEKG
jgi:hypothetical protein